jgi:hypothetical protein
MRPPSKEEAAALTLVPLTLTADETRMVMSYRATAVVWRADIMDFANMVAKMFPLVSAPPAGVRLVDGADERGPK